MKSILTLNEGRFKNYFFDGYGRSMNALSASCKVGFWNAYLAQKLEVERIKAMKKPTHQGFCSSFTCCSTLNPNELLNLEIKSISKASRPFGKWVEYGL